jgi:outer membrane protein TolC
MRTLAALLVFLALPGAARAERTLSLAEALDLARGANRDLAAARERVTQAEAEVALARSRFLPTLSLQGRWLRNDRAAPPYQPLEILPAWPALSAAGHGRAASEATLEATSAELLLGVAQAYYAAAGAEELLAARREATAVTARTLKDARTRLAAGAASPVDVTRAELASVQAEQAVAEAEELLARVYRALATLTQLREPFAVAPGELVVAAPGPVEELTRRALSTRPEVRALREVVDARAAAVRAQELSWAPSVAAFATGTASDVASVYTGEHESWAAGLQLQWNLFDGGARIAERQRAAAQRREAELQLAKAADQLTDEVADRARAVDTRRSAVAASERGEFLAVQALDVVRTQYGAGSSSQIELLQAQDALVAARVRLAQARFDLAVADLQLRRSVGAFPRSGA